MSSFKFNVYARPFVPMYQQESEYMDMCMRNWWENNKEWVEKDSVYFENKNELAKRKMLLQIILEKQKVSKDNSIVVVPKKRTFDEMVN